MLDSNINHRLSKRPPYKSYKPKQKWIKSLSKHTTASYKPRARRSSQEMESTGIALCRLEGDHDQGDGCSSPFGPSGIQDPAGCFTHTNANPYP